MFDFIKKKIAKIMLNNWLKGLLATFKQKNPTVWIILAAVLTAAQVALNQLISQGVIPTDAQWIEWIIWAIGLLTSSGEVAKLKFKKELKAGQVKPEKLVHLSAEDKYQRVLDRNRKLEELIERA